VKIFISWSGDVSLRVAKALRDWLPLVLQSVEPYVSSEDIDKGARWSSDIARELEASSYGILCVTPDNVDAPWLVFEAGALSKEIDKSHVSPFLFGLGLSDLRGPLLQFQATLYSEEDVRRLLMSINACEPAPRLDESKMRTLFSVWWPKLQEELAPLQETLAAAGSDSGRQEEEPSPGRVQSMLEEVLLLVRSQQKLLSTPQSLLPPEYLGAIAAGFGGTRRERFPLPSSDPVFVELRESLARLEEARAIPTAENDETLKLAVEEILPPLKFLLKRLDRQARSGDD
jgi:hypothetical protein